MAVSLLAQAALAGGMSWYNSQTSNSAAAKAAGRVSRAEGQAIAKERLNTTLRNSYATAIANRQLALQKRQLTQQGADISAAGLMAKGDADLAAAATGGIGASIGNVAADIDSRVDAAMDAVDANYEAYLENYNSNLEMMVVNTNATAPTVRDVQYDGPSALQTLGSSALVGLATFGSNYLSRKMQLGLGTPKQEQAAGTGIVLGRY